MLTPRADRVSASGPKGEKRPTSYVAGLMGKSGFRLRRSARLRAIRLGLFARGGSSSAASFPESFLPDAARPVPGRAGGLRPGSRPKAGRMSAADLDARSWRV